MNDISSDSCMSNSNDGSLCSHGLFVWDASNLIAATESVSGQWHGNDASGSEQQIHSCRITTDTRTLVEGDIFLALVGDNFDGHDYLAQAAEKGAVAAIVQRVVELPVESMATAYLPQLLVTDTRLALGQLAAYRRQQHPDVRIIALTGSSGKTTCKEMLGSILSRKAATLITRGNLNNDLGVPMMLLELSDSHRYAVLELGANHIGEIAYTTQIVQPEVACVLNIGTAHLGEFGSRDGICQAKAEIYHTLNDSQYAIVPDGDEFASQLRASAKLQAGHVIGFGHTDVTASHIQVEPENSEFMLHIGNQSQKVCLPLAGEHNINNALAASACAYALGLSMADIVTGLQHTRPAKGRLNSQLLGKHRLIDDTYNANPHSVRAAAKVLASQTGIRVLVLGDISELGEAAIAEHQGLGRSIAATGIDALLCVGQFAQYTVQGALEVVGEQDIQACAFADKDGVLPVLRQYLDSDQPCTLLFKGSRIMQMESLIDKLSEE